MSFNRDLPFGLGAHFVKRRDQTPSYVGTAPRIAAAKTQETPGPQRRSAARPSRPLSVPNGTPGIMRKREP